MFVVSVFIVASLMLFAALVRGRAAAACTGWAAAMLLPVWLSKKLGATVIDARVTFAVLLAGLALLFVDRRQIRWAGFLLADAIVLGLVLTQSWSMHLAGDFKVSVAIQLMCHWLVPYVFGRLLICTVGDVRLLTRTAVFTVMILSTVGVIECITGKNLINIMFFGSVFLLQGDRFGLHRAIGSMDHPIYFGILVLLLLPWALHASKLARQGAGPAWWRLAPYMAAAGVASSLSRGPILGVGLLVAGTAYVHRPRLRMPMTTCAIAAAVVVMLNASASLDVLHKSSGEEPLDVSQTVGVRLVGEPATVVIDQRQHVYNGTTHRYLQFLVFSQAARDAGWFGFGKWGTHPEHVVYLEPEWRNFFWSIDNHYILMTLESGRLGIGLFIALGLVTCVYASKMAFQDAVPQREIISGMLVGVAISMLLLLTVWFAPSFGFFWLMNIGMVCQWWAEYRMACRESRDTRFEAGVAARQCSKSLLVIENREARSNDSNGSSHGLIPV